MRRALATTLVLSLGLMAGAATRLPDDQVAKLVREPAIAAALALVEREEARVLRDQVDLTEIPAPAFREEARGLAVRQLFEEAGLANVRVDEAGNVLGDRPGSAPSPRIVLAAHLDTVFPEGTDVRVKREGAVLRAPGIADDGRGLAVLVGVARALEAAGVRTRGPITFVADVGEEGLGDLRGMKQLFGATLKGQVDGFVSVDGGGHDVTSIAVGSRRCRVTFRGAGGHSFAAFGLANPIHALGRAVARISDLQVPSRPKVTFNVGRIGGGTSVNSISHDAWFEIDMRSSDREALAVLETSFRRAVDEAVLEENRRASSGRVTASIDQVGDRPAGRTPDSAPILRTAIAVSEALGLRTETGEASTDANVPIGLGIPAITVGGGGRSSGVHSLDESFDTTDSWKGTQRVLLLVVALAGRP